MTVSNCHIRKSFGDLNYFYKFSGLGLACLVVDIGCVFEISSQNVVVHEFLNRISVDSD
jgi:hypothetical protein